MKLKTTLALVLLVGASVALYLVGPRVPFGPFAQVPQAPRDLADSRETLATLTPDRITSISIRRDGQPLVSLDRDGTGSWRVSGNWPGNVAEIRPLVDLLGSLHSRFLAEPGEKADDLARYGLDRPRIVVEVKVRDESSGKPVSAVRRLALGESPQADYRFVRPTFLRVDDRPEVLRLAPGLIGELSRPADHYRARRLFPSERTVRLGNNQERIERLDARELLLRQENQTPIRLVKTAEGWELREPTRDQLDPDAAEKLLGAVADLWAEQFVQPEPAAIAVGLVPPTGPLGAVSGMATLSPAGIMHRAGLDRPARSIQVTSHQGVVTTLQLGQGSRSDLPPPTPPRPGAPMPDSFRYARLEGSDVLFEIQDNRLADVFVPFETLRDSRLARFNTDDAERIEIRHGDRSAVLVKEKKDSWKMLSPREGAADGDKVRDLLQKVSTLDASEKDLLSPMRRASLAAAAVGVVSGPGLPGVVLACTELYPDPAFGLERPDGTVTVQLREKARAEDRDRSKERTITLRIGKPGWAGKRLYLQAAGWPRIDSLDDSLTTLVEKPGIVYRGKQPLEFTAKDVARVEVRRLDLPAFASGLISLFTSPTGPGLLSGSAALAADQSTNLVLERAGEQWQLTSPVTTTADAARVTELLDALGKFKVLTFVADDVAAGKMEAEYGLGVPRFQVRLTFTDATKPARTLSVGNLRALEPGSFARLDGGPDVFALPEDVGGKLAQAALSYMPSALWQIAPEDEIVRFRVAKAGQDEYQLERKDDRWQVTGPFTVAAPSDVVERLSSALRAPRAEEYRSLGGGDLGVFGLDRPAVRVTVTTQKGQEHSLWVGAPTTTGKPGRYARLGSGGGIFVVDDKLAGAADQSALAFLNRDLLDFDAQAVSTILRQRGKEVLELSRQDEAWKLVKPADQPADDRKVPDLVRQLSRLRAERIAAYKPKDLKPFGLDVPEATLTVRLGEKKTEHVLLLGKEQGPGERFVMVKGAPAIGVLPAGLARQLLASPLTFRSHDLARIPDADTMKLEAGERKITFGKPEGTWKVTLPISVDADHDGLEGYFNNLSRLRADELVAEKPTPAETRAFGLDRPTAKWQILNGEEVKLDLLVGAAEPLGKRRYARLADRDVVFLLDDKLSAQVVAEYRPRTLFKEGIDPAQVESVKFGYARDGFELKKVGGDWLVTGKPEAKVLAATVSDTLSVLRDLKLERYVKDDGAQLKLYGLDPVELVLEVTTPTGKQTLHLGGLEGGTGRRYARLPGSKFKDVFVLDQATSSKLHRDLATLMKPVLPGRRAPDF